jgi:NAD(P)-dependent dehydrogenase (short-subunit alcohol dehydrogenase family)
MDGLRELGCQLLTLDVTDPASVCAAVDRIVAEAGRIDGEA